MRKFAPNGKTGLLAPTAVIQTFATADATHAARTAAALTDNSGGAAADGTIAVVNATGAGNHNLLNVAAATTTGGCDQQDISAAGGAVANIVQPDVPRNIVYNFTDANASISAYTVTAVGFAPDGTGVTEIKTFADGLDPVGSVIFARVTSVTTSGLVGNGAGDTFEFGYGVKLGVSLPFGSTGLTIQKLKVGGTGEAASATDQTNNSFTATTAPNGTNDYEVWYSYRDANADALRNAVKELSDQINKAIADGLDTASFVNTMADAGQARGDLG